MTFIYKLFCFRAQHITGSLQARSLLKRRSYKSAARCTHKAKHVCVCVIVCVYIQFGHQRDAFDTINADDLAAMACNGSFTHPCVLIGSQGIPLLLMKSMQQACLCSASSPTSRDIAPLLPPPSPGRDIDPRPREQPHHDQRGHDAGSESPGYGSGLGRRPTIAAAASPAIHRLIGGLFVQ